MQNNRRPSQRPVQGNYRGSRSRMRARKRKRLKLILAFAVMLLLIIILVGSCGNNENDVVTTPIETQQPIQEPTATPITPNSSPSLKFGELLSITETPTYLFDENDQFIGTEDNIVVIKAKISPSYNNEATIKQNYLNIEGLIKNQGFDKYNELQYWAVADMTDGSESKVFSCTVSESLIKSIKADAISVDGYEVMVDDLWILPSLLE